MTTKLTYNRKALLLGIFLNGISNIPQCVSGLDLSNAQPHTLIRDFGQALGKNRCFTHRVHSARIAEPTVFDNCDINI
jgi:hypothetical protein